MHLQTFSIPAGYAKNISFSSENNHVDTENFQQCNSNKAIYFISFLPCQTSISLQNEENSRGNAENEQTENFLSPKFNLLLYSRDCFYFQASSFVMLSDYYYYCWISHSVTITMIMNGFVPRKKRYVGIINHDYCLQANAV